MRKNKKLVMALAIILALVTATAGATFAWYTSLDQEINHMETDQFSNGDVALFEVYDPEDPFNPGVDINKDVWVTNTGDSAALVRISFAEVLTLLANNGNSVGVDAVWATNTLGIIPHLLNAGALDAGGAYDPAKGWATLNFGSLPTGLTLDAASVAPPSGVTVKYLDTVTTIGSQTKHNFDFIAYVTIAAPGTDYDGKLQLVTFQADKTSGVWKFTNWKYMQFQKDAPIKKKWADLTYFDATAPQIDLTAFTKQTPAVVDMTLPRVPAITDAGKYLNLLFTSNVITALDPTPANNAGKWWYNAADGYFYYIGKLEGGQASNPLLDAVGLKSDATNAYSMLEFDLIVNMEAIQNVKEALTATSGGGWAMDSTSAATLEAVLLAVNAFVLT